MGDPLRSCRDATWQARRQALRAYLRARLVAAPCRSAAALYATLHGRLPPPGSTWADLLNVADSALAPRARAGGAIPLIVSWNLRSLRDPTTHAASGKRACLRTWVQKGYIVLLQETHWAAADKAIWEADLQGARVLHSPAVLTQRGGTSRGVAIIIPAGVHLVNFRSVLPGFAVEAQVTVQGAPPRLLSTYFPPTRQAQTLTELRGSGDLCLGGVPLPTVVGGDLNAQWPAPRRGEAELVNDWLSLLRDLGTIPLACAGGSCTTEHGSSQIDFLALPAGEVSACDCAPQWTAYSDHAPLRSTPAQAIGRRYLPITPSAFKAVSADALVDLRRRVRTLEGMFGVSRLAASPAMPTYMAADDPGDCPHDLPVPLDVGDGAPSLPTDLHAQHATRGPAPQAPYAFHFERQRWATAVQHS